MKPRLVYTQEALGKYSSKEQKEIEEAVAEPHWVCGAPLFDEQHPLTDQVVVREELTCCSPIEALFYKCINKLYAADEVDEQLALCAHCALQAGQVDEEIAEQHHGVLPVCADCKSHGAQAIRGKRKSGAAARAKRTAVAEARSAGGHGAAKRGRRRAAATVPPAIAAAESTDDDEEQQQEWETEDESA
jgi:hypothetical protein